MSFPTSDDELLLLHNSRCSKCRASKALLEERGVAFSERFYLDEPLSKEELEELATRLGKPATEWVRRKEDAFAVAGLTDDSNADAILDAMAAHPILVERPILVRGQRAVIGRPPEDILDLL
ncbi:MAG: arsenate reductase family protein [Deltaproteobacteria bacterium]|nr:arsenate reductase family protein [Deltaproteobacteria bacterium]MBW2395393.1 arsenate reductase family protein [Deltaproteobacteria bacterium]